MLAQNSEKMVYKWAGLLRDALGRSIIIRDDEMSAFVGHSVMFCGNTNTSYYKTPIIKNIPDIVNNSIRKSLG